MAKTKISEFSTTAGNNTDINSINIAEGCAPSGINDAIRELMRQLKEFQTGGAGDSVNSGGDFSVATNKFTVASASGNTAVAGTLGVTGAATLSSTLAVTGTTTLTGALVANGNATLGDGSGDTVTVKGTPTLEVNPTLSGGTANGVLYLNGSKVATSGSALVFDGTNLGLGVTPSAWSLGKAIEVNNAGNALWGVSASEIDVSQNAYYNSGWKYASSSYASRYEQNTGVHKWWNAPSGTAGNAISFSQAMGLTTAGELLIGTTSFAYNPTQGATIAGGSVGAVGIGHASGTASGNGYVNFAYDGSNIGSITQSGTTAVLYNVTSDQRLKENIADAPDFGSVIDSIKVRSYDWKADGNHQRAGFVAQELVTVAPEAVHQPADPEEMMAVDYSKLVPMLVKEIQSLRARVAQLESN